MNESKVAETIIEQANNEYPGFEWEQTNIRQSDRCIVEGQFLKGGKKLLEIRLVIDERMRKEGCFGRIECRTSGRQSVKKNLPPLGEMNLREETSEMLSDLREKLESKRKELDEKLNEVETATRVLQQ